MTRHLMLLHIDALYTRDATGDLVRVNEHNGAPAPRFFLGRTTDGVVRCFRHDVDLATRQELEAATSDDVLRTQPRHAPPDLTPYARILGRVAPVEHTEAGPAYYFPQTLPAPNGPVLVTDDNAEMLRPLLQAWIPDVRLCPPLFALQVDGQAVAVCASVRITSDAYEAGVETSPAYRGRGYAAQVVTAWARAVREMGRVPLYSTSWQNTASRAVARKLGLVHFGSDVHLT
jgi:RimJ/RimL family protein N-acetyltransferase